ncbi:MAG: ABC transporter substrate-binding protein [Thermomicrobiales bacterium]
MRNPDSVHGPSDSTPTKTATRRQFLKAGGAVAAASFAAPAFIRSRSAGAQAELGEAELTFFFGANPAEAETRQTIIDAFTAKYPQITITPRVAEGSATEEIQVMVAGGDAPDVMMAWELDYSGLAQREIYADLNEFLANDAEFAGVIETEMVPELLGMFNWEGAQYVLPEQYAGVVLYYNKALFEEAGVAPPPADWTDTSWTYETFLETAKALTKMDGDRVTQFGFADAWWPPLSSMVWATSNGGNWFDTYVNPTKSTISDPKMVEGVQFYADLANVHRVKPNAEEMSTQAGQDMFMGGRAAMALVGHWFYPAFSTTEGLDFDIGVFPVGPGGTTPKTDLGSTGLAVSATTEYPEQAWEFVKFSTGPEGQAIIAESGLFVPVLRSVGQSEAFLNSHTKIQNTQVFIDAIANSVPLPITPVWNEIADVWARETDRIMRGEAAAADVYAELEPQINDLLADA